MSTSQSPLRQLQAEADRIAAMLKRFERRDFTGIDDPAHKLARAVAAGRLKVGIVMDDKVVTLEIPLPTIAEHSEASLAAYVLRLMKGTRERVH